jgi:hypothetical protein
METRHRGAADQPQDPERLRGSWPDWYLEVGIWEVWSWRRLSLSDGQTGTNPQFLQKLDAVNWLLSGDFPSILLALRYRVVAI